MYTHLIKKAIYEYCIFFLGGERSWSWRRIGETQEDRRGEQTKNRKDSGAGGGVEEGEGGAAAREGREGGPGVGEGDYHQIIFLQTKIFFPIRLKYGDKEGRRLLCTEIFLL